MQSATESFASRIIRWQRRDGRHDLPWQDTRDPYRIWVSEIMLQQTQVTTVIPYYQRFMARFPALMALAEADEQSVLALWSGLGYYARGRNLHRAARLIRDQHGGEFPRTLDGVMALPGVGRSTAGAICAFAFGQRHPILDGNVKRVLARALGIAGFPGEREVEAALWARAQQLLPEQDVEPYTQGLMDLGARLCVRRHPLCGQCPLLDDCEAYRQQRQHELPAARPRRVLPRRHAFFVLVWDGASVLLQRRPPAGIWGGLWCFPLMDQATESAMVALTSSAGATIWRRVDLGAIEHGFTHYHLTINPIVLEVRPQGQAVQDTQADWQWMTLDEAQAAGLPAPVRALLPVLRSYAPPGDCVSNN